jgi:hypothetical protein
MDGQVLRFVQEGRLEQLAQLAGQKKRVLSWLTALSYDPDPLIALRVVEAFGLAAQQVAHGDPEYVRTHLRRLFWTVNDESGGIGWRAPELIGETLYRCPAQFDEFVSPLIYLLDMEAEDAPRFQAGVLWAIGRIAPRLAGLEMARDAVWLKWVLACLESGQAQTRGMAVWCLQALGYAVPLPALAALQGDESSVQVYRDRQIQTTTVAALAAGQAFN